MMSVTFEMITVMKMVLAYLDWLSRRKRQAPLLPGITEGAIRIYLTYASACRPEYISLSSELAGLNSGKRSVFGSGHYVRDGHDQGSVCGTHTRTKMGLRDQFLMIFFMTQVRGFRRLWMKNPDLRIDKSLNCDARGKGGKIWVVPLNEGYGTASG